MLSYALPQGNSEAATIPQLFQANLAAIGLQLDIQVLDFATYIDLAFGTNPRRSAAISCRLLVAGLQRCLESSRGPRSVRGLGSGNVGQYCNARVEDLLEGG